MAQKYVAQRIPDGKGGVIVMWSDGSITKMDGMGNIYEDDPTPNPLRAAMARSGNPDDEGALARQNELASAENARRFNETLSQQSKSARQQYEVSMRNARTQQEQAAADAEYKRAQTELAKQRLAFDERNSNADRGLRMTEISANLRGPQNYFQAANFARGMAGNPQTATFLSALQNGQQMAGYGAQGGMPDKVTVEGLQAKMLGQSGGGGASAYDASNGNYLAQIGNIAAKGAHQVGAGGLEQLTDTERKLFTSGLDELGYDSNTFLDQYKRSRIGNRYGNVA